METIPHSRPWITDADIATVSKVLWSRMLGQGELVLKLEQQLASWLRASGGVAVASGSASIVLALHGLNIGSGDEVVIPTYVCRSILEAVYAVGATPVLCDAGPNWVITPEEVAPVMSGRTRAIVIPHLYGIFAAIDDFRPLGIPIIEDCAQALNAKGKHSKPGDVTVISFHPTKCLTSGEGGMAVTSDHEILARMRICRDGKSSSFNKSNSVRLFAPMSDIAAGLALSQLDRYEQGLTRRLEIAANYLQVIKSHCPDALNHTALNRSMYFRFPLRLSCDFTDCQKSFAEHGISVKQGVDTLLHRIIGLPDDAFPVAVRHFETTVSLPIYPALSHNDELRCINAITHILPRFQKAISETL